MSPDRRGPNVLFAYIQNSKLWILFRFDAGVSNEWFNAAEEDRLYQETFPFSVNKDIKIIIL